MHGAKDCRRLYVYKHVHCAVCFKLFNTRERLINHLRSLSKVCRHNYVLRGFLCGEEDACAVDEELASEHVASQNAGRRRQAAVDPVVQLVGPKLPVLLPVGHRCSAHHSLGYGHNYHR